MQCAPRIRLDWARQSAYSGLKSRVDGLLFGRPVQYYEQVNVRTQTPVPEFRHRLTQLLTAVRVEGRRPLNGELQPLVELLRNSAMASSSERCNAPPHWTRILGQVEDLVVLGGGLEAHLLEGLCNLCIGSVRLAARRFVRALRCDHGSDTAWAYFGLACRHLGKPRFAMMAYKHAIACDPAVPGYHSNLGICMFGERRFDEAMQEFGRALEIDADYTPARVNKAKLALLLGDFEYAISEATTVIDGDPQAYKAFHIRGSARRRVGRFRGAIDDQTRALDILPRFVAALQERGLCYESIGMLDRAGEDISTALLNCDDADDRVQELRTIFRRIRR